MPFQMSSIATFNASAMRILLIQIQLICEKGQNTCDGQLLNATNNYLNFFAWCWKINTHKTEFNEKRSKAMSRAKVYPQTKYK